MIERKSIKAYIGTAYEKHLERFCDRKAFKEAIRHEYIELVFLPGRKIIITLCGRRTFTIPQRCRTLLDIAEWINRKDF